MKRYGALYPAADPGSFRHRIEIQQNTGKQTAEGTQEDWATILTARASIEEATSRQYVQAGETSSQSTHVITLRWRRKNIDATMRVRCGNQIFEIQNVFNIKEMNVLVELMCMAINEGSVPLQQVAGQTAWSALPQPKISQ